MAYHNRNAVSHEEKKAGVPLAYYSPKMKTNSPSQIRGNNPTSLKTKSARIPLASTGKILNDTNRELAQDVYTRDQRTRINKDMSSTTEIRESDAKGRLTLPKQFANSTLLLDIVSDVEIRLRKAKVVPLELGETDVEFLEEKPIRLSGEDAELFFAALNDPPEPNDALKKLMQKKP